MEDVAIGVLKKDKPVALVLKWLAEELNSVSLERFVGRVEMLSPRTERTIRAAMATNDTRTLDQFERFLAPFLTQIKAKGALNESPAATKYAQQVVARVSGNSVPCIQ